MLNTVTIVIPALDEEAGIAQTIRAIPRDRIQQMGYSCEIVVVDNDSKDRTAEIANDAGALVVKEPYRGYGRALKAGFDSATGDIIVTSDADGTYPVDDIPRLIDILTSNDLDFLSTDRFALMNGDAMSLRNKMGNKALTLTLRMLYGLNIRDSQSGMWVFRRSLLPQMTLRYDSMALSEEIKIEACYFLKARWTQVPIKYHSRIGEAKLRCWRDGFGNLVALMSKRISR